MVSDIYMLLIFSGGVNIPKLYLTEMDTKNASLHQYCIGVCSSVRNGDSQNPVTMGFNKKKSVLALQKANLNGFVDPLH